MYSFEYMTNHLLGKGFTVGNLITSLDVLSHKSEVFVEFGGDLLLYDNIQFASWDFAYIVTLLNHHRLFEAKKLNGDNK